MSINDTVEEHFNSAEYKEEFNELKEREKWLYVFFGNIYTKMLNEPENFNRYNRIYSDIVFRFSDRLSDRQISMCKNLYTKCLDNYFEHDKKDGDE